MSEQTDNEDFEQEDSEKPEPKRNFRRELEDRAAAAEARALAAEKQLAFKASGLDLANPQHKFFADNYSGDLTEDAVKAKALELGFIAEQKTSVPQQEITQQSRMDQASNGAPPADITGTEEQKVKQLLESDFNSLEEYAAAANAAGLARNLQNG